jgi:Protein of unknown function (DUF3224)
MGKRATGTVESGTFNEETYSEVAGGLKLTRADGVDQYHGDIEGEATYSGITIYEPSGAATLLSVQRIVGQLGDRKGSFVVQIDGTVDESGGSEATWKVLKGSGTDQLAGLTGKGGFVYTASQNEYTLTYDFE